MWMQFAHPCNLSPYADCDYSVGTNFHVERWAPVTINAWDRTKKTSCLAYSSTRRQKNYRNCLLLLNTSLPFEIKGIIVDTWIVHSSLKKTGQSFFFVVLANTWRLPSFLRAEHFFALKIRQGQVASLIYKDLQSWCDALVFLWNETKWKIFHSDGINTWNSDQVPCTWVICTSDDRLNFSQL